MTAHALAEIDRFKIVDQPTGRVYLGYDQEWYGTECQRLSGCGPTTVCNLLWYLSRTRPAFGLDRKLAGKKDLQAFMEDVWQYVTPTRRGIPTTRLLTAISGLIAIRPCRRLCCKLSMTTI